MSEQVAFTKVRKYKFLFKSNFLCEQVGIIKRELSIG